MKKVSVITLHRENAGQMATIAYKEYDASGRIITPDGRDSFVVLDPETQAHIDAIEAAFNARLAAEEG